MLLLTSSGKLSYKNLSRMGNVHNSIPAIRRFVVRMFRNMRERRRNWRRRYEVEFTKLFYISSCVRQHVHCQPDGHLLRVVNDIEGKNEIEVEFTGTNFDQSLAFVIEPNDTNRPNTFRCCLDNQSYYLCADDRRIILRRAIDDIASKSAIGLEDTFKFRISKVTDIYSTISSEETKRFLLSDKYGNASMCSLSDETLGRDAWFQLLPWEEGNICDCISITGEDFHGEID
ncbi:uncharacterized protein LOC114963293 [Acropora millepora]|uniref:uncharacterized protein LOC114963293 n=1 Tax=Acropora millepora TaxID=45264 RepID=UPI001CF35611|nr:uncharacterized protein LOC114963293 [Acropora millepora]